MAPGENACKWDSTEPARGQFLFDGCDAVHQYADRHVMAFRGHNLCWDQQNLCRLARGRRLQRE